MYVMQRSFYVMFFCFSLCSTLFPQEKSRSSHVSPLPPHAYEIPVLHHTADGTTMRAQFEKALSQAQRSILIFTFSFSDMKFMEILNAKAEQGLGVTIIINKDHIGPLMNFGHSALRIFTRRLGEGRVHHNICVIDDQYVWIGSANLSTSGFSTQDNVMVELKSARLADSLRREAAVFEGSCVREHAEVPTANFGDQKAELFLLPHWNFSQNTVEEKMNKRGKQRLIGLIEQAKTSVQIAMMVWTDPELATAVIAAHQRGVRVEILLHDLEDRQVNRMKQEGVVIMKNPKCVFMHNKLMLIDDRHLVNGSANFSRSSFSRNDESFLMLTNLTDDQVVYMRAYWQYLVSF